MTKLVSFAGALLFCTALTVNAQQIAPNLPKSGDTGPHTQNLVGGCKACHAPHNGNGQTTGGVPNTGQFLLWAVSIPDMSTLTYGTYFSNSLQLTAPVDLKTGGQLTNSNDGRMYSLLCLSCHDGVTSSTVGWTNPQKNSIGSSLSFQSATVQSFGLTNDHPINMNYVNGVNKSLANPATVNASLPLFNVPNVGSQTVQCATCHDPHNDNPGMYLRQQNNSAHCTTCHL